MKPTLESDDVLLVNKFSQHFGKKVEIGKIYIFVSPTDPQKLICKRVTAVVKQLRVKKNKIQFQESDFVDLVDGVAFKTIKVIVLNI